MQLGQDSNHFVLVSTLLTLFDKFSEIKLTLQFFSVKLHLNAYAILVTIVLSAVLNLVLICRFLLKHASPDVWRHMQLHRGVVSAILTLSLLRFDLTQLLFARFRCRPEPFSAPVPQSARNWLAMWGVFGTLFEDLPQFALLLASYKQLHANRITTWGVVTMVTTALSIVSSLFSRVIACVSYNRLAIYRSSISPEVQPEHADAKPSHIREQPGHADASVSGNPLSTARVNAAGHV